MNVAQRRLNMLAAVCEGPHGKIPQMSVQRARREGVRGGTKIRFYLF